jgi:hypothetical protein
MCVLAGSLTVTPARMCASRMRRRTISSARASCARSLTRFASSRFLTRYVTARLLLPIISRASVRIEFALSVLRADEPQSVPNLRELEGVEPEVDEPDLFL